LYIIGEQIKEFLMVKFVGIIFILVAIFMTLGSFAVGMNINGNIINMHISYKILAGVVGGLMIIFG
jgi:hypothetical protein